jgi:3-methyladenine DNA glycosylase AlkD
MKPNPYHAEILSTIRHLAGKPGKDPFLNHYLGNEHPLYSINVPTMRKIGRDWLKAHRELTAGEFVKVLTSLVQGQSNTEKCMAGLLLNLAGPQQRKFDPSVFNSWLNHLVGWVEIDTLCTGDYAAAEIPGNWTSWKKLLLQFSKDKNINKRRASLVLFCLPLRKSRDERVLRAAFQIIDRLKHEREVLITKAISWVLRCAIGHHKAEVRKYVALNKDVLPAVAVRETLTVLKTGKKTKSKKT